MVVLKAEVPVQCHVVYADLAGASEIPYVLPVLEHVREKGGRADAATLSRELFTVLPVSRSLLRFCSENGLADAGGEAEQYAITPDGEEALKSGRVLVRRRGMWKVHYADHEMIPEDMRAVMIGDGSREAGFQPQLDQGKQPRVEDLPERIARLEGRTLRPPLGDRRGEAVLHCMHGMGKQVEPGLRLRLHVVPGASGSKVFLLPAQVQNGGRAGTRIAVPDKIALPDAGITYGEAVRLMADGERGASWDVESGRLLVRYSDVSDEERATMKRALAPRRIRVGRTEFEADREVVDIFPVDKEDAQMWAMDMLDITADGYLTREAYSALASRVRARFEGFEVYLGDRTDHLPDGTLPSLEEEDRRLFWLVQAMEDWDL